MSQHMSHPELTVEDVQGIVNAIIRILPDVGSPKESLTKSLREVVDFAQGNPNRVAECGSMIGNVLWAHEPAGGWTLSTTWAQEALDIFSGRTPYQRVLRRAPP